MFMKQSISVAAFLIFVFPALAQDRFDYVSSISTTTVEVKNEYGFLIKPAISLSVQDPNGNNRALLIDFEIVKENRVRAGTNALNEVYIAKMIVLTSELQNKSDRMMGKSSIENFVYEDILFERLKEAGYYDNPKSVILVLPEVSLF